MAGQEEEPVIEPFSIGGNGPKEVSFQPGSGKQGGTKQQVVG